MPSITPASLLAALCLAAAVPSQTFVVDANNGPGTNFTSLDTAVASVPDGSTLIVRAGNYATLSGAVVNGKGMSIFGQPGAVTSNVQFTGLNANQRIVVKGMTFGTGFFPGLLGFQSCQGSVHVEDCVGWGPFGRIQVNNCAQAIVVRCTFDGAGFFTASDVVCIDTDMRGASYTSPGLSITGGQTQLVHGSVIGGASPFGSPGAGIDMNGGSLRLLGTSSISSGTGTSSGWNYAIRGTGSVRAVPGVSLISFPTTTPPTTPGISVVTVDEAATSSTAASLGGVVTATLQGSANLFGGLVIGFPQAPTTFPDLAEELWVNPIGFAISGMLGVPLTYWVDVPNAAPLQGIVFGWQGVTFGPAGAVLSNPAWFCVH